MVGVAAGVGVAVGVHTTMVALRSTSADTDRSTVRRSSTTLRGTSVVTVATRVMPATRSPGIRRMATTPTLLTERVAAIGNANSGGRTLESPAESSVGLFSLPHRSGFIWLGFHPELPQS